MIIQNNTIRFLNAMLTIFTYAPFVLVWIFVSFKAFMLCAGIFGSLSFIGMSLGRTNSILLGAKQEDSASALARYVMLLVGTFCLGVGITL